MFLQGLHSKYPGDRAVRGYRPGRVRDAQEEVHQQVPGAQRAAGHAAAAGVRQRVLHARAGLLLPARARADEATGPR